MTTCVILCYNFVLFHLLLVSSFVIITDLVLLKLDDFIVTASVCQSCWSYVLYRLSSSSCYITCISLFWAACFLFWYDSTVLWSLACNIYCMFCSMPATLSAGVPLHSINNIVCSFLVAFMSVLTYITLVLLYILFCFQVKLFIVLYTIQHEFLGSCTPIHIDHNNTNLLVTSLVSCMAVGYLIILAIWLGHLQHWWILF